MSTASAIDRDSPWPGLASYDESAHAFFSGRSVETAELARRIADEPLTVLFGKSGLGKSSLLRAGVFPVLRTRGLLPVLVRLYHDNDAPAPMEQVAAAMFAAFTAEKIEHPPRRDGETLWEYLHRDGLKFWTPKVRPVRPVIVLDQFEEVFTVGRAAREHVTVLREELADLAENRIPAAIAARYDAAEAPVGLDVHARPYKLVISLREDFLPDLEDWLATMPSLRRNRMRLLPMRRAQALEAVHNEYTAHLVDAPLAQRIVDYLAAGTSSPGTANVEDADDAGATVEPALLSLVCRGINEARRRAEKARFDDALFESGKGRIVADFYRESVADQPPRVRRFIEDELITEQGFRNSYAVVAAVERGSMTRSELATLVDRRLLRVEHHLGAERIELTHDLLTRPVLEGRVERVAAERAAARRRRVLQYGSVALVVLAVAAAFGLQKINAVNAELNAKATIEERNAKLLENEGKLQKALGEAEASASAAKLLNGKLEIAIGERETEATNAKTERDRAVSATRLARSRELAANAIGQVRSDGSLALLLALEAMRAADTPEARSALLRVTRYTWPSDTLDAKALGGPPTILAMDPSGTRLAVVAADKLVSLWTVDGGAPRALWRRTLDRAATAIAFGADSREIFVGSDDRVERIDAATGDPRGGLALPPAGGDRSGIGQIAISADGRWMGVASDGRLLLHELGTEPVRWTTVRDAGVVHFALSADARRVSAAALDPLRGIALERNPDGTWSSADVAIGQCSTPQSVSPGSGYVIATWKAQSCTFSLPRGEAMEQGEEQQAAVDDSLASPNGGAFLAVLANGDLVAGRGTPAKRNDASTIRGARATAPGSLLGLFAVDEAATRVAMLDEDAQRVRVYRVGGSRPWLTPFKPGTMAVTLDGRWIVRAVARAQGTGAELQGNAIDDLLSDAGVTAARWRVTLPAMPVELSGSRGSVLVKYNVPGTPARRVAAVYDAATGAARNAEPLPGDVFAVGAENQFLVVPPAAGAAGRYRIVRVRDAAEVPVPWADAGTANERLRVFHRPGAPGFVVLRTSTTGQRTLDIDGYLVRGERIDRAGSVANVPASASNRGDITDDGRAIRAGSLWYEVAPGRVTDARTVEQRADRDSPMSTAQGEGVQARSAGGRYAVVHRRTAENAYDAWLVSQGNRQARHLGDAAAASYWFSPDERWLAYPAGRELRLVELGGDGRNFRLEQIAASKVAFIAGGRLLLVTTEAGDLIVPVDAELWQRFGRSLVARAFSPGERCEYGIDEGAQCRELVAAPKSKTAASRRSN